jgi:hypothetical protein
MGAAQPLIRRSGAGIISEEGGHRRATKRSTTDDTITSKENDRLTDHVSCPRRPASLTKAPCNQEITQIIKPRARFLADQDTN